MPGLNNKKNSAANTDLYQLLTILRSLKNHFLALKSNYWWRIMVCLAVKTFKRCYMLFMFKFLDETYTSILLHFAIFLIRLKDDAACPVSFPSELIQ